MKVSADVHYPAVVKLPTFVGMKKEQHIVSALDLKHNAIVHDKVVIEHPEYKYKTSVRDVIVNHQQIINLNTGKTIPQNKSHKQNFGYENEYKDQYKGPMSEKAGRQSAPLARTESKSTELTPARKIVSESVATPKV